jgi:O-acetylhomoserine (thiol)-lyase
VLEKQVAALALPSGQAASGFAVHKLARARDNIVSSIDLYGGTWNLFAHTLKDQGIEAPFFDPADPGKFRRATDDRTVAYYRRHYQMRNSPCSPLPMLPKSAATLAFC